MKRKGIASLFPWPRQAVLQSQTTECALACLVMVLNHHGFETDLRALRRRHACSQRGTSLRTLIEWARASRFDVCARRVDVDALPTARAPAILHWDMSHFVVLERASSRRVTILDPAMGRRRLSTAECSRHFSGVLVELTPNEHFQTGSERQRLSLRGFLTGASGLTRSLLHLTIVTLLLQALSLAPPFYLQLVVDRALSAHDTDLVSTLGVGFAILAVITAATHWLRLQAIVHVGTRVTLHMTTGLVRHLMRLPLEFFERRSVGDVVSRFNELNPIQKLLTTRAVTGVVDGVMGISTLLMMYVYSAQLATVALAVSLLLAVLVNVWLIALRQRRTEHILAQADEMSNFLETIRGMQSIKSFGKEAERELMWQGRLNKRVNREATLEGLVAKQDSAQVLLYGLGQVLIVYLAGSRVVTGAMSVGMMFAFISYQQQFAARVATLIGHARDVYFARLYLERLGDIALAEPEVVEGTGGAETEIEGALALENVCYRYGEADPWVLQGINLSVRPGEVVVITGPSGQGKTTLLKIMMGLVEPTAGSMRVGGVDLKTLGVSRYRSQVGAVMQSDRLFAGTFSENISFFDPKPDFERIVECSRIAHIHGDIMRMPMRYDSLIGDMGTILSAGQQQRLLLARAFYKRPKILFLDEGTANLDQSIEARINKTIASLGITLIMSAHRPEIFAHADRVLLLSKSGLVEMSAESAGRALPTASSHRTAQELPGMAECD